LGKINNNNKNNVSSNTNVTRKITNFGGILHHGARARKQKTLKILCFVICVEDYHKLIQM
jgi:hypothetical protein